MLLDGQWHSVPGDAGADGVKLKSGDDQDYFQTESLASLLQV